MHDDLRDIADYYNSDPEREHFRLERHQLEYDLTWRYLDQYLPAQGTLLEIGAATGRYTVPLAKRGYSLTAVDLSAANLEVCRKALTEAGLQDHVRLIQADVRDLAGVPEAEFDAALLMGPLYHLGQESDRKLALHQVFMRLQDSGILFSTFISRLGIMGDLIKDLPNWVEDQVAVRSHLQTGKRPDEYPRGGFRGYFAQAAEIAPLHQALGFETLALAGVEPAISADDESYNRLAGEQRRRWLELLYEISRDPSILGASRHLLYIGRKMSK